ncbi:hypothetical protein [uncultured Roseibium sp.]|uniref:hypothetical protein n=1 Tax=uncultured Roseibium sp. TaxID=1936171 RepID=UPI00260C740B|nr:hypothetical protein [uncultured Roseibium sp.]
MTQNNAKEIAKNTAHLLISDWANSAHRGVGDAITVSILNDLEKLNAVSALDYVLQPLAVVTPFFAPAMVAVFKAGSPAINPDQYRKLIKNIDNFTAVDKNKILSELSMTNATLSTVGAAKSVSIFGGVDYNRTDILAEARTHLDKMKAKLIIAAFTLIDKEFDQNPEWFARDRMADKVLAYKYVNRVRNSKGEMVGQLDEALVRLDLQAKTSMALIGGFSKFSSSFVDGTMQAGVVDSLNQIVLKEFHENYPGAHITECELKSIHKYGGTLRISEQKARTVHKSETASGWSPATFPVVWHTETKTYARRISKIHFKESNAKSSSIEVHWHPNIQNRFTDFGFGFTPV